MNQRIEEVRSKSKREFSFSGYSLRRKFVTQIMSKNFQRWHKSNVIEIVWGPGERMFVYLLHTYNSLRTLRT